LDLITGINPIGPVSVQLTVDAAYVLTEYHRYKAFRPDRPVNMGVNRYALENLFAALHTPDLKDQSQGPNGYRLLSIDIAQRGVGTAACGPDTLESYRIRPGRFTWRLFIGDNQ
jgi:hypothetical protein